MPLPGQLVRSEHGANAGIGDDHVEPTAGVVEFADAQWVGPRMPFPVRDMDGTVQVTPARVEARDMLASFADVPVRFDVAATRGLESDSRWSLRFRADAETLELPDTGVAKEAPEVTGRGITVPAELVGIAQRHLPLSTEWLLHLDAETPVAHDETVRPVIRDLLRHGGFKPSGRSKPASEYLVRAASDGGMRSINAVVDALRRYYRSNGPIPVKTYA